MIAKVISTQPQAHVHHLIHSPLQLSYWECCSTLGPVGFGPLRSLELSVWPELIGAAPLCPRFSSSLTKGPYTELWGTTVHTSHF